MGIISNENSQTPEEDEDEDEGTSYLDDLPETIEDCIEMFGEDDPLTQQYKQELIDLTRLKKQREDNPSLYEEEEEEEEEQWHAGMVPNLRPKSEKGLEEDSEDEDQTDSPALNPEAPKAEPDLSPMSKAGGGRPQIARYAIPSTAGLVAHVEGGGGWVMKVTILIRGDRYTLKNCVVYGPDGEKDEIRSIMARVYQATWSQWLGYPQAYVGARLAEWEGGTVEVVHEKEDDDADDGDPTRIMIYH